MGQWSETGENGQRENRISQESPGEQPLEADHSGFKHVFCSLLLVEFSLSLAVE